MRDFVKNAYFCDMVKFCRKMEIFRFLKNALPGKMCK